MTRTSANQSLGEVLRTTRTACGMKLRTFAKDLEISPTHLSDVENDRRVPSEELLREMAGRLKLDFDELMSLAGRLGGETEQFAQREPVAAALFRKVSASQPSRDQLKALDKALDQILKGRDERKRK